VDSGAALLAERALELVAEGQVLGLGSGRTATAFVLALGARVRAGLRVAGVPTSEATADLARQLGIRLVSLAEHPTLDLAVDGADELDPQLDLIKGYGGALLREKIVASAARRFVVLVGREKVVPVLGSRGTLPVEVVPFGASFCSERLGRLGLRPRVRGRDRDPYATDSGNWILDCATDPIPDPGQLELAIRGIPGVVATGLFLGMADSVLVENEGRIEIRTRPGGA
jgi:ribose 5-phosphate isomerase A